MTPAEAALLVVDDNADNRYTLTRQLKREGYTNLTTTNDGRQALAMLRSQKFDLMLLDWKIQFPQVGIIGFLLTHHEARDVA